MAKKCAKPEIRFAGFANAWEQHKLGSVAEKIGSGKTPHGGERVYKSSGTPLIRSQNVTGDVVDLTNVVFIDKATDDTMESSKVRYDDVLLNITGASIGRSAVYKGKNNANVNQHVCIIRPSVGIDSDFVQMHLASNNGQKQIEQSQAGGGRQGLNFEQIGKMSFFFPLIGEQRKIGSFLRNLDNLITLHQRKHDKLANIKKAMLGKMFPQDGASVPEVRFAGFTGAWEQRKMGEIVSSYADPVATPVDGYVRLGIRSHAKGTFHNYVRPGMELETAQMHRVGKNNFIVNITFGWEHAVAITDENDAGKLVSHRFPQFSFNEGMVSRFFKFSILDEKFRHHLWLSSPGGAGRNRVLKLSEMLEYPFWTTSAGEQSKIADFLEQLDYLIIFHQRELDKLQNLKKAFLEKMFV